MSEVCKMQLVWPDYNAGVHLALRHLELSRLLM